MVIFKGARRFEITVAEEDGEWLVKFYAYVPGRLLPTLHLLHRYETQQDAEAAAVRKWSLLFPEDAALGWREPAAITPRSHGQKGLHRPEN